MEFAATLPLRLKLRGLTQKYLLRRAMRGLLPEAVLRRPKMGFGVPIDHWFRHELREMAYDVLLDDRARQRGYFRPETVRRYLDEHVEGRAHHHPRLWSLLMLEQWHRVFIDRGRPPPRHPRRAGPDASRGRAAVPRLRGLDGGRARPAEPGGLPSEGRLRCVACAATTRSCGACRAS